MPERQRHDLVICLYVRAPGPVAEVVERLAGTPVGCSIAMHGRDFRVEGAGSARPTR